MWLSCLILHELHDTIQSLIMMMKFCYNTYVAVLFNNIDLPL